MVPPKDDIAADTDVRGKATRVFGVLVHQYAAGRLGLYQYELETAHKLLVKYGYR